MDIGELRQEYDNTPLDDAEFSDCPFEQFEAWFMHATSGRINEPNAMVLTTVDGEFHPTQRTVLLKYFDKAGFVFFTNYDSRKAIQIEANNFVSVLFPWYQLNRQLEINGRAEKVSITESAKYFALRPRGSQLGAWVSEQSRVVSNRSILTGKLEEMKQMFLDRKIPRPPSWGGFRIKPIRFEFWQGGQNRLHDRIQYLRRSEGEPWNRTRIAP